MASVNVLLQDRAVDHAIDLRRYANHVLRRIIATLNRSDAALAAALAEALMRMERDSFTVERLEVLLASVRTINAQAYAAVDAQLQRDVREIAGAEAEHQAVALRAIVPASVPVTAVGIDQVYAAALARPFQGRLLRDWAAALEAGRLQGIRNAVRQGIVEGRTTPEIVRQIRGTKANAYADGLLERPRRELTTVVNTAISHTAQRARAEFYKANADIVQAVQWVSTLDDRTTPECAIRDGLLYTAETHAPIDHSIPWLGGPGALHFNCRSVDVAVIKSWKDLGLPGDAATRASMDGQVPADLTYAEWFARQSAARQDEIVGPTRGELFRAGKVSFEKFTDDKGRWLTIEQLKARGR